MDRLEFPETQIGRGLWPLAQHGRAVLEDGVLSLYGTDGRLIDQAPAGQITARPIRITWGQTLSIRMNGTRYTVSPGWGGQVGRPRPTGLHPTRETARTLLAAIRAAQGGGAAAAGD
ncbi:hypothetical protein [Streptomyces aidingensis]|uniref:PH domain-containing protein n=1 Tax=Streptomyces aidingensis TaxID=910347 RepID=A0A1I1RFN2_9ACTN|nr:hypothetical protein [Streptomyces aidingensis]SFD29230.1 hypothetical protein SAMN05421773_112176 [Streptomyces aidingensis]